MFENANIDHCLYSELMNEIKAVNKDYKDVRKSREYGIGRLIITTGRCLKSFRFKELSKNYRRWINGTTSAKKFPNTAKNNDSIDKIEPNYFATQRIAVYTVVFGKYDSIPEPYCRPDNVDYYIVTDQDVDLSSSVWKQISLKGIESKLSGLDNIQKNRYLKMHPQVLFPKYEYSIYVDGNIQIVSDVTEFIHRIGSFGVAMHLHSSRSCVYEEAKAVLYAKKESKQAIDEHIEHLKQEGYPEHYGMLECNIIARRHTKTMEHLMDEWWNEFCNYSKRDQLSFPYVLYKNKINVEEVGTLGNNVHMNLSFRVLTHK